MKKLHSLFILSILALTMFVACQMPTDGTGNGAEAVDSTPTGTPTGTPTDTTPTVDADEATYGFVKTVDYTVYKDNVAFPQKIKGSVLINLAKENNFAKDKDYTIEDGNKVNVITGSRLYDWLTPQNLGGLVSDDEGGNDNGGSGTETTTKTYKVNHGNDTGTYSLVFDNYKKDGYTKGETVKFLIKNGDATPTGLYLVNVRIEDSYGNDIKSTVGLKIEDHKITFTMPSNTVNVSASFEDVVCRAVDVEAGDTAHFPNWFGVDYSGKGSFLVALRFDTKEYDNLKPFGEKFIYELYNLEFESGGSKSFFIQLGKYYNVYDYNTKEGKYHENPVVIYNGEMREPKIDDVLGCRWVDLNSQN